jgi:short-subunit dehydrogenase
MRISIDLPPVVRPPHKFSHAERELIAVTVRVTGAGAVGPKRIAQGIYRAITKGKDEVYLPWIWWPIMMLVKAIPETIFKRCRM